jgi:hypothetical protein
LNVPDRPTVCSLDRLVTGAPASGRNHTRWNDDLTHLLTYNAQPILSHDSLAVVTTTPHSYYVGFRKNKGVNVLRVQVEVHQALSTTTTPPGLTCEVTVPGSSINFVETTGSLWFDGTTVLETETPSVRDPKIFVNHVDISGLTDGSYYDLKFTVTDSGTTYSRGLYSIHVTEVPLANVDPVGAPTTEIGTNQAWLVSTDRNVIVDGTASSLSHGTLRLLNQLEMARYQKRRHLQTVRAEATTLAWNVTATGAIGSSPFPSGYTVSQPIFSARSRALYGTSTANTYRMRVRYINSAANKLTIRVAVTAVGGGTTNYDYQLANAGSFTAAITDVGGNPMAITLPGTGTDQECTIALYATNDTAATTSQVSQVLFVEEEG